MDIPKETEKDINEFQSLQNQLQMVLIQKQQVKMQLDDIDSAVEELKEAKGEVFKAAGSILVQSNKDDVTKELSEKKDSLNVRLNVLSKQEEKLRSRLIELKNKIEKAAGDLGAG